MGFAGHRTGSLAILLSYAYLSFSQSLVVPTSPLANWDYIGCYTDSVGARSLSEASTSGSNMTNSNCVDFCSKGGYAYAGTEYSQECWCGRRLNTASNRTPDGDCNYGCSGKSNEACGGSSRLTIFNNTAFGQGPPYVNPGVKGYRGLGCYNDDMGIRALATEISASLPGGYQNSTVANCISGCSSGNYTYAGLEYYGECWCGNVLHNEATVATDQSTCNTLCNGNQTEICGGPNRLDLYTNSPPPSSSSSISMSTVSMSSVVSSLTPSSRAQTTTQSSSSISSSTSLVSSITSSVFSPTSSAAPSSVPVVSTNPSSAGSTSTSSSITTTNATSTGSISSSTLVLSNTTSSSIIFTSSKSSSVTSTSAASNSSSSTAISLPSTSSYPRSTSLVSSTSLTSFDSSNSSISLISSISSTANTSSSSSVAPTVPVNSTFSATIVGFSTDMPSGSSSSPAITANSSSTTPPSGFSQISIESLPSSILSSAPANTTAPSTTSSISSVSSTTTSIPTVSVTGLSMNSTTTTTPVSTSKPVSNTTSIVTTTLASNSTSTSTLLTSTSSAPIITGVPTTLPRGWSYKGCWIDNANGRVFENQLPDANDMTVERCIGNCTAYGYGVAGIEYASQCFCGNYLMNGATMGPQSDCNMACSGNASEFCGAGNRLSVYSNSTADLTVYAVPAVQKTGLPKFWQYVGCLHDDAPGGVRALSYQLILNNNNTANNCISQCSAFGYGYGGMEYGNECYCGDLGDIQTANVASAPESDCSFACSGNATTLCGGSRRLSLYKWTGPNFANWKYATGNAAGAYQFLIGGVVVPLVTQVARNGKITFLEKSGTGPPNSTGAYELDIAQLNNFTGAWRPMHVKTDVFCSASLTLPDKVGRQLNVGGWALDATFGVRLYWPDGSPGVWGKNDWQENVKVLKLQNGRWYPTAMIMANGTVLVVGGEEGSNGKAIPTLEILPTQGPVIYAEYLNRTDPNNLYPFLAVLPSGGIFIQYYNEAAILDEVTLQVKQRLPNVPAAVNRPDGGRTYPNEGTAVLLPQSAPYTEPLKVLICGGSTPYQGFALDNCVTIAPDVPNANWTLERMPSKRVMSCMAALPDGTYLILNGAHQGQAGFGQATDPNLNAILYDPTRPLYSRFTVLANTTVARMYHSEAILMDDGRVLVSGSDPEDPRFPQEYRVEVFIPPYLMGNPVQPVVTISASQADWVYSGFYTFTVDQPVARVSLMGVTGSTHGNSMGQRTLFPAFVCSGRSCTVTAPPDAHTCPPGWFQLYALNAQGVPSKAVWVRIGGDPAQLGNWPQQGGFKLPGV